MPGYVWSETLGQWRQLNTGWVWAANNQGTSAWRRINTGWVWTGSTWRQIFSSGDFTVVITNTSGTSISNQTLGSTLVGSISSNVSGTYSYIWQFSSGNNWGNTWTTRTSGSISGTNVTTSYTTTSADVSILENYANNYKHYFRISVTRGSETQESGAVQIHKHLPVRLLSVANGTRDYNNSVTYNATTTAPYPNDTIVFWNSSSWRTTTNLSNDTRPDYYVFTYTIGSTVITRDSRTTDSTDPRTPTTAATLTVPSNRIGSAITCQIKAHNSHPDSPTTETTTTVIIDDGIINAPTGLVLSESDTTPGKLDLRWNRPQGGNDTLITYTWELYRNDVFIDTGATTSLGNPVIVLYPGANNVYITTTGDYKFRVTASQSGVGGGSRTSGFSNVISVTQPGAFSGTIENLTSTLAVPGTFTISAFAANASFVNIYDMSWTASAKATNYTTRWTRPDGTFSTDDRGTLRTDYWGIFESGNHTLRVTATNDRYQYVRIDWTAASGAGSYRLVYYTTNYPFGVGGINPNVTVDFDSSTTVFDLDSVDNLSVGSINVVSITAYRYANQRGPSRIITNVGSLGGSNGLGESTTRNVSRTENLTYLNVTAGTMNITGNAEPGGTLNYTYSGWNPPATDSNWSFARRWGVTQRETGPVSFSRGTGASPSSIQASDIGQRMVLEVTGTYKDVTLSPVTVLSQMVVPAPPSFTVTNNFDLRFSISDVASSGATNYFGTYTGGTISNTAIASTFTSPILSEGQKTIELFARTVKSFGFFPETIDGRRGTTSFVTIAELGAFTWNVASSTITPARVADTIDVSFASNAVTIDWAAAANATHYLSTISGGTQGNRSFETTNTIDSWTVSNGGVSYSGDITSINKDGRALVDWNASNNAQSYKVVYTYRGNIASIDTTSTQATISVGEVGFNLTVNEVRAYATSNQTGSFRLGSIQIPFSPTITIAQASATARAWSGTSLDRPTTPTGLTAAASIVSGTPRVTLNWTRTANTTEYGVYWSPNTTAPTDSSFDDFTVTQPASGNPSFVHDDRGQGTTYYYWVRARNSIGTSGWSARASATTGYTTPATPGGVSITGIGFSGPVGYRWTLDYNSVFNATLYRYQWRFATSSTGTNATAVQEDTSTNAAAKTVSSINFANRRYCQFRVRAENPAGNSSYSSYTAWTFSN